MGSYARFEHYLTNLEVETCPEFWPPSPVSGPLCGLKVAALSHAGNSVRACPARAFPRCHTYAAVLSANGRYVPGAGPELAPEPQHNVWGFVGNPVHTVASAARGIGPAGQRGRAESGPN